MNNEKLQSVPPAAPPCPTCHQPLEKWNRDGSSRIKAAWWCPGCATPATLEERGLA